jgi:hypothetical protein
MCTGGTAVGRSRVLWTRCEFGIRILNGLIVLMLEVSRNFVMCSGRIATLGRVPIYEVCADRAGWNKIATEVDC